jgi:hypothetical protein
MEFNKIEFHTNNLKFLSLNWTIPNKGVETKHHTLNMKFGGFL